MLLQLLPSLSSLLLLSLFVLALPATYGSQSPSAGPEEEHAVPGAEGLTVRHTVVAQLGPEHFAHALYRRDAKDPKIIAWGDRILQWSLKPPYTQEEVVPLQTGHRYSNGGCLMDVDGDGHEEFVVALGLDPWTSDPSLYWYKAPPGGGPWQAHKVADLGKLGAAPHDIVPLRFAGGVHGVVMDLDRKRLVWYQIPADPTRSWIRHDIGAFPTNNPQSGIVIGDIAGHGRQDILSGMFWLECPADPVQGTWVFHRYGDWDGNQWGGMAQVKLADMDGDGKPEIVASEAEIPNARLAVFRRDPSRPDGLWECHPVDQGLYCPHSVLAVDLNGDGRPDIVAGEMTAGGWDFPLIERPHIYVYLNEGGLRFKRCLLSEGWGVHEMGCVAGRSGGETLLYAADEIQLQKFKQMHTHVSIWTVSHRK